MTENVLIAIITSVLSLIGVVVTVIYGNKKTTKAVKEHTDVTIYRIEQLEKKQDVHNGVVERVYIIEKDIELLKEKVKVENHRINDLEEYHKQPINNPPSN